LGVGNQQDPMAQDLQWSPPNQLTAEMAQGIADITHFYVQHGLSNRRLKALAKKDVSVVEKWQKMMEIFLTTQVHVIAGMGYGASEQGLTQYAKDLASCLSSVDIEASEELRDIRRDTWRTLVATSFDLELEEIPTLSIVDARNLMHKVSSKMIEPDILLEIQIKASKVSGTFLISIPVEQSESLWRNNILIVAFLKDPDAELEVALKHNILQQIIVNQVYLGGSPSIAEEAGFGTGPTAYAKLQCAMSDHEGDPLIAQYAASAMMRIWQAAGLDMSQFQGAMGNYSA
jgi:hypothetical protein